MAPGLLQRLGVHPTSVAELADLPAELVTQAVAYAEAAPGIVNKAGWVVAALRQARAGGWTIPDPPTTGQVDWGARLRAQERADAALADLARAGSGPHLADPALPHAPPTPPALTAQVRALLRARLPPADRPLADQLSVALDGASLLVIAAAPHLPAIRDRALGALRAVLADLALADATTVGLRAGPPGVADACPAWVDAARWPQLPRRLRDLLAGTTCAAGRIFGVTPAHTRQLWDAAETLVACGVLAPQASCTGGRVPLALT